MTPEQIELAKLSLAQWQLYVTALAIFLGPLAGVVFTLWFQARKEKSKAKLDLFLLILSERKSVLPKDVTRALNQIDVVFFDCPKVKTLWHEYYEILHHPPGEARSHKWLELLSAMAENLGYKGLSQIDLDKFYIPQGHVDDAEFSRKISQQFSRVLEGTERFLVIPRTSEEPPKTTSEPILTEEKSRK